MNDRSGECTDYGSIFSPSTFAWASAVQDLEVECLGNERRIHQLEFSIKEMRSHVKDRKEVESAYV